jgi:hypothetical protein
METRSNKFLMLFEGFKLGSLGVSKTLKPGRNIEEPQKHKTKVWDFSRPDEETLIWTQTLSLETINALKLYDAFSEADFVIKLIPSFRAGAGSRPAGHVPKLEFYKKEKKTLQRPIATFLSRSLSFDARFYFQDWLDGKQTEIKQKGLTGTSDFLRNWKQVLG